MVHDRSCSSFAGISLVIQRVKGLNPHHILLAGQVIIAILAWERDLRNVGMVARRVDRKLVLKVHHVELAVLLRSPPTALAILIAVS